jgi:hypothetical protein
MDQDKKNSVGQWYQQYLGRQANPDEVNWWTGASNFGTVEDQIKNSQEAKTYAARGTQPQTPYSHDAFRDAWLATGSDVNKQNQVLTQFGIDPNKVSANGTVTLPDGSIMDLRQGAKAGNNTAQWLGVGQMNNGVAQYYPTGGSQTTAVSSSTTTQPQTSPLWDALYNQLMGRANQSLNISPDDPIIKGQTDAYSAQQERARKTYLDSLAESAGPYASGAMLGQSRITAENMGQDVGNFQSQLMGRELQSRRDEIAQALQSQQSMLSDAQRLALQKELAYLNDATQRYGIATSADTQKYGIDTTANTAANRLGLDYANSQADYWLRSQGLT